MPQNVVLNWSSGKDAALAYYLLQKDPNYHIASLLTTINADADRIFMHGIRESLLDAQAAAMGQPIHKVKLPPSPDNSAYEAGTATVLGRLAVEDIDTAAYGDIFLEDLRAYREAQLAKLDFKAVFPLWQWPSIQLIEMLEATGIKANIVCVDGSKLGPEWLGKTISKELVASLPEGVDPCGENGEFHTFVFEAPFFRAPIAFTTGEVVHRAYLPDTAGFYFMDLVPV